MKKKNKPPVEYGQSAAEDNQLDYIRQLSARFNTKEFKMGLCATEEDFNLIYPDEPATYDEWRQHLYQLTEELQADGIRIELVEIKPEKYFRWLNGRPNSQKARSFYVTGLPAEELDK